MERQLCFAHGLGESDMDQQTLTAHQFGANAEYYLTSNVHANGADLERLAAHVRRSGAVRVLDLGCGAGHASYAAARGGAGTVVAYDLSPQMLAVVAAEAGRRGHSAIFTQTGPAEQLPFEDASFDLIVTRYSAHHWRDVEGALNAAARKLKYGGTLIVIDVLAPEDPLLDTVLQTVEILRDASHVRDYRESEWRTMLRTANFSAAESHRWKLPMVFDAWVARIGTPQPRVAALSVVFDELPQEARDYFAIAPDRSFQIDAGWLEARRA